MRVLVSEHLAEEGLQRLRESGFQVDYFPEMTQEELLAAVDGYEALVVRSRTQVTREVIGRGRSLRIIGRAGVGVNNIDLEAATARGIVVVNVPDGNTIAACEHTLALMLALARNVPAAAQSLAAGRWERQRFTGVELYGKTLGVVGFGRIGSEVAKRALAFGMKVVAYDPYASPAQAEKLGVRLVPLDEVLREADFLTIHAPLTPQTRNLIGARELALTKPGARLVNCARGGIVNEQALYEALASGHLAGAALDVFEREPPPPDHPLLRLPTVLATPHLGASTVEAQVACALEVAEQVARFLAGLPVRNAVNLPAVPEQEWKVVQPLLPLAEILGRILVQALPGPLAEVEVAVRGPLEGRAADLVASAALAGILSGVVDGPVNAVNAPVLARQKGIHLRVSRGRDGNGAASAVVVRAGAEGRLRTVAGHLGALGQPRVTEIDGLPLDIAPAAHMLLDFHEDRPGIIGRVGTILGNHGINIASMYVGRHQAGGKAVLVLTVDEAVPEAVLEELRRIPAVRQLRSVVLPRHLLAGEPDGAGPEAAG